MIKVSMTSAPNIQDDILPEQILQAALQLYLKHGVRRVTMDDVAKVIGKSRGVLYYYYKNRDEIFEAVIETLIQEVVDEIAEAVDKAASVKDKIRAFCLLKIKTSEEKKSFFTAMEAGMDAEEISRHSQIMTVLHKRLMQQETALLKKVLSLAGKSGAIRGLKPKESGMLIFIILSGIRGIKREMNYDNDFSKLDYAVEVLADMVMRWLER